MKKRIAIFTHGGIGTGDRSQGFPRITQLVNSLAETFDLTIYSIASFNTDFNPTGYHIYSVPKFLKPLFIRWLYLTGRVIAHSLRKRYNAIYSFWGYPTGFVAVVLGKIFRIPSLVNILGAESANIPEINYGHLRNPVSRKLVLWTCHHATYLIAVSSYQVEQLKKYGLKREVYVIPYGVDKKVFFPIFKTPGLPLKILHVANLTEVKDQETLIKTFQSIRQQLPATLRIVGPDYLNGRIQRMVKDFQLQNDVEFIGPVLYENIVAHYQWADVIMLTSLSEGQNNAMAEGMMCGLLPVSTNVGAMFGSFGEQVGVVAHCKDYKTLARKTVELFHQPAAWEQKRGDAYQWAASHDLDWTIAQLKSILNDACSN